MSQQTTPAPTTPFQVAKKAAIDSIAELDRADQARIAELEARRPAAFEATQTAGRTLEIIDKEVRKLSRAIRERAELARKVDSVKVKDPMACVG